MNCKRKYKKRQKGIDKSQQMCYNIRRADVMELADVTDSKSVGSDTVRVQVPPSAPKHTMPLIQKGHFSYMPHDVLQVSLRRLSQ